MYRRDFLKSTGAAVTGASLGMAGLNALLLPGHARAVPVDALSTKLDVGLKKKLATAALDTATKAGATYCDVRIGRYLRQFVITRENKVQNVVNTESTGAGIRVIVNNAWGFAASTGLTLAGSAALPSEALPRPPPRPWPSRGPTRRFTPPRCISRRTRATAKSLGRRRLRNRP